MAGLLTAVVLFLSAVSSTYAGEGWQYIGIAASASLLSAVAVDKSNPEVIYAAGSDGLYKTSDRGISWKVLGPGLLKEINFLYLDREKPGIIYAASQNGLFRSQDGGEAWQKIFIGKDIFQQNVLSVDICYSPPKSIFIATAGGVFFSPANLISWQKVRGKLADSLALSIAADPANSDGLWVVSSQGLFGTRNRLASYERLYSGNGAESEDSAEDTQSDDEDISSQDSFLRHLAVSAFNVNQLYLGTLQGIYFSPDGGKSWQRRVYSGLLEEEINYLLPLGERLLAATSNGVFDCQEASCRQLYSGADFKDCLQLAEDSRGNLYLASDKGLFRLSLSGLGEDSAFMKDNPGPPPTDLAWSAQEPTIQEIQQKAIRYAEVYPEKISNWRRQARLKAFFPQLDLSYDKTVFTSTSFPQGRGFVGPLDWGLTLSWDLGDLIFSTEQTSIDVRSRLMVQLRDDILDEVTRLYFERRRLQIELKEARALGAKQRMEKELRLQELTASIDGLTGGYLSRSLLAEQKEAEGIN